MEDQGRSSNIRVIYVYDDCQKLSRSGQCRWGSVGGMVVTTPDQPSSCLLSSSMVFSSQRSCCRHLAAALLRLTHTLTHTHGGKGEGESLVQFRDAVALRITLLWRGVIWCLPVRQRESLGWWSGSGRCGKKKKKFRSENERVGVSGGGCSLF